MPVITSGLCPGRRIAIIQMLVFAGRFDPVLTALEASTIMLLGGDPLGPWQIWWNFVSSRKERIGRAKVDWQNGRTHLPLNEDQEFIPCPKARDRLQSRRPV